MTIEILKSNKIQPIYMAPGDTITLSYTDADGATTTVLEESIEEEISVDTASVFKFTNEFGLSAGIGGVFGK